MIKIAANAGIFVIGAFMLGFPTETKEEMKATIDFACRSKLHVAYLLLLISLKVRKFISRQMPLNQVYQQ